MPAITEAAIRSTEAYLEFLTRQHKNVERYAVCPLDEPQGETCFLQGGLHFLYLYAADQRLQVLPSDTVRYLVDDSGDALDPVVKSYDPKTGRLELAFVKEIAVGPARIEVDFKWLVRRCLEWFRENGSTIGQPPWKMNVQSMRADSIQRVGGLTLSECQVRAVSACLKNSFSYVWGPPGSGKTQLVMTAVITQLLRGRRRVLVVAPTNNAVENAIRAVLNGCSDDLKRSDVIRLGVPTPEFLQDFPDVCEDSNVQQKLKELNERIDSINELLRTVEESRVLAKRIAVLESEIYAVQGRLSQARIKCQELKDSSVGLIEQESVLRKRQSAVVLELARAKRDFDSLSILRRAFAKLSNCEPLQRQKRLEGEQTNLNSLLEKALNLDADARRKSEKQRDLADQLEAETAAKHIELSALRARESEIAELIESADGLSLAQLLDNWQGELKNLMERRSKLELNLSEKRVLGMTLDGFIGRTMSTGINVHHVLLDEAAYAPLAKTLPLLSLKAPITLLGDHCQLPPVCECDDRDPIPWSYWGKSALFLEDAWSSELDLNGLAKVSAPSCTELKRVELTESFRFGDKLAVVLQQRVYSPLPLTGRAEQPTAIHFQHVANVPKSKDNWVNEPEAKEVVGILGKIACSEERSVAVLTPYKKQARKIRDLVKASGLDERVEILNTHKAQGREWDVVIFSAVDPAGQFGPFLSDSSNEKGRLVLNTTISRVRQDLYLVADGRYWRGRDQLISDLIAISDMERV